MKNMLFGATALAISILTPFSVMAERAPTTMGQDARVRHVNFNQTDVIRIDTHLRVNTSIELGPGERINQVLLGDSESFEVNVLSNRNVVSIKPIIAGASTNMTIYTGRRAIAFFLTEGRSRTQTFRVAINFPSERSRGPQLVAGGRDLGYQHSGGAEEIRPIRVWNDGRSTFFEFRQGLRPSIFGLNASGYEITQTSQTRGTIVRVNGVRNSYVIRANDQYLCIVRSAGGFTTAQSTVNALRSREF